MSQLRTLKVVVQPVFVVDDGDGLTEHVAEPITVAGADWPGWATERWPEMVAALAKQLEVES